MKTVLITGTLGFIFSNFVRLLPDGHRFVGLDKAVKPYHLDNMLEQDGYRFHFADLMDAHVLDRIFATEKPDIVIGGAAESFVDDSITDILPFLNSNIIGTQHLVNQCLKHGVERYLHVSTDEVYGQQLSRDDPPWTEEHPIAPRNPYAASKACAEHIVRAAALTHGLRYQMVRSCNVYGPRQKPTNLIPMIITALAKNLEITIHGSGLNFRQYVHVTDFVEAIWAILDGGEMNGVYNIGDNNVHANLELVDTIASVMGIRPRIRHIEDRKAHDFGYRVTAAKLHRLGWRPHVRWSDGLASTIDHYSS